MKKFLKHSRVTQRLEVKSGIEWERFISSYTFARQIFEEYAGSIFNNGQFKIHTKESSLKWSLLLNKEYFVEELEDNDLLCFAFNWQGIMYCVNRENNIITYFDPATCEFFQAEDISLIQFLNEKLTDSDYDLLAKDYFGEACEYLDIQNLKFGDSIGHKVYLHLGGNDDIKNLEVIDTEVLWDTQIQVAESINELPD